MQNESETEFHRVYKVSPTQQLTKLTHLLRESGAVVLLVNQPSVCQLFINYISHDAFCSVLTKENFIISDIKIKTTLMC